MKALHIASRFVTFVNTARPKKSADKTWIAGYWSQTQKRLITCLLLSIFGWSSGVHAEFKLGYINTERVFKEASIAISAQERLQREFSKREKKLKSAIERLESMRKDLEQNGASMSESKRQQKERAFIEANAEFQTTQKQFREDLGIRQNEEMASILREANGIIAKIAEDGGFDLIVQDAVWINREHDITDQVIKVLGNK